MGQGFGRTAIISTLPYTDTDVVSIAASNHPQGRRGFIGLQPRDNSGFRFATVNLGTPSIPIAITDIPLELGGVQFGWPNRIELTTVNDRQLAILVGGGGGTGKLAVIDVTDTQNPLIQAFVTLQGSWGSSIAIDQDGFTVFVGTPEGVEIYNLTDPAIPVFAGVIDGLSGEIAAADGVLVSANTQVGVQTAALRRTAVISEITPAPVIVQGSDLVTATDITINVEVLPQDARFDSTEVRIFENGVLLETLPTQHFSPKGKAVWVAGQVVSLLAKYTVLVVIDPGTQNETQRVS